MFFIPKRDELQGFHTPGPRENLMFFAGSSHGLRFLFRGHPSTEPLHRRTRFPEQSRRTTEAERRSATPSLRSRSLQRLPARGSGMSGRAYQTRPPAPPGVHNLLALSSAPSLPALFHAGSALGITLQSFVPLTQPCAVIRRLYPRGVRAPSGSCSA